MSLLLYPQLNFLQGLVAIIIIIADKRIYKKKKTRSIVWGEGGG